MSFHPSNPALDLDDPLELKEPDDGIALMNAELQQMSLKEREEIYHDIHGITAMKQEEGDESPEFIASKMKDFQEELQYNLPKSKEREALDIAYAGNPSFVEGRMIAFLKGLDFDVKKAATMLIANFYRRRNLFGDKVLTGEVCYDDLDEETRSCILSGYLQTSPLRDSAGRTVILWLASLQNPNFSAEAVVRLNICCWELVFDFIVFSMNVSDPNFIGPFVLC